MRKVISTCRSSSRKINYSVAIILLLLAGQALLDAQVTDSTHASPDLKLLFIGDIMGHDSQIASAFNKDSGRYDYTDVFKYISPLILEADIAIANLEVTLAGPPYKGYPRFSSPVELAAAGQKAGIGVMVTANNHSVDRGLDGINRTISSLDSLGIMHTGTYRSVAEREAQVPHIVEKNGFRLALLNYTYGTNGISIPTPAVVDLIDKDVMAADIDSAKAACVDGIIVFIHWGAEYDTLPGKSQIELAGWLKDKGVNLIIGSHPHVIQQMEIDSSEVSGGDRLVAYSLGNFVSNQRKRYTDGGAMVSVTLGKEDGRLIIRDAGYILTWVYTPLEEGKRKFYILPAADHETDKEIPAEEGARVQMKQFILDSRRIFGNYNLGVNEVLRKKEEKLCPMK
jgi:poly-gamma-glutamate capsule biosynthesis protein CapA/YwtB (metallophosphatase superfamily)